MNSKSNRVAAIQMASGPNVGANLLEAERLISEAAEDGAELVVLPENFAFMGKRDQDLLTLREDVRWEDGTPVTAQPLRPPPALRNSTP